MSRKIVTLIAIAIAVAPVPVIVTVAIVPTSAITTIAATIPVVIATRRAVIATRRADPTQSVSKYGSTRCAKVRLRSLYQSSNVGQD